MGNIRMYPYSAAAFGIKSQHPQTRLLFAKQRGQPQGSIFSSVQPSTSVFGNQSQPQTQGSSLFGGRLVRTEPTAYQNPQLQLDFLARPWTTQIRQPALTGLFGQPRRYAAAQQPQQNTFGSSLFGGSTNQPQGQLSAFGSKQPAVDVQWLGW